ncbi:Kinase superfamily protein isoform 2 [Hibiscus syriacus]|uniref:Kinase superfamily protein isoform 2 n=1 Tax=Hibiscus syriacus TaxID=106335 RepID=A0A6A2ZDA5_HIBSY|nr:Kinase superfamily protein isoform 2 [Hibiscus syriacus]
MNALASGFGFKEIQEKVSHSLRPWHRSFQFWVRAVGIYTGYKVFQLRVSFVKDAEKQESMWEKQHELAADKIYAMCSDLAPATPFDAVQLVLEEEFGRSISEIFENFEVNPLGSASIAQVHRARLRGDKNDVVVQRPGVQDLMMTDIRNLQAFALYMQKTDIKFDLYSVTKEEKQASIGYEFDFPREANAMERIRRFLYENNKKTPVLVPRVRQGNEKWLFETRITELGRVLVMDYIEGIPILNLGDKMARRINPGSKMAMVAKQNILKSLTLAYGQMILKTGFFHADSHPGNILICKGSEVALLDYGQVKDLPDQLRLGYANLVLAMADNDPIKAIKSYRELGIDTSFPEELFSILRTVHLLRGLSVGLGINYSCAEQWRPIAEEALYNAGRLKVSNRPRGFKPGSWELPSSMDGVLSTGQIPH